MDKYNSKKNRNQDTLKYIVRHVTSTTLTRFKVCGEFLAFVTNRDCSKNKLYTSNFCEHRFCPMCSWRLAKKDSLKISVLMKYLEDEHNKDFIFITLTAPNVIGDDLIQEINRFNLAFKNMMKRKDVLQVNKGYIRKLEITYNSDPIITWDMYHGNPQKNMKPMYKYYNKLGLKVGDANPNYDTYHIHFHIVIAVNKTYFSGRTYIKQSKWLEMWREVMNYPEITQVDVRKLKKSEANKEIQEIAKYSAKDSDMLVNQEVFDTFFKALRGRQVITYNGLFKDANKLYKDKKLDKYKLIDNTEYVYFLLYRWGKGEYVETEKRELTEDERNKFNKQLIDEDEIDS